MIEIKSLPILAPGFYRLSEAEYHADPCPEPSLSRSIGKEFIEKSAAHAKASHPRLTPDDQSADDRNTRRADLGSAAHAMLFGQPVEIAVIDETTYQKKAAKEEREAAYGRGAVPLLRPDFERAVAMVERASADLYMSRERPVIHMTSGAENIEAHDELTAVWLDKAGPFWARARMDRLVIDRDYGVITIIDYKTTELSAAPAAVARAIYDNGYDLQDGFYRRGIRHLIPEIDAGKFRLDFLFIVQEQRAPFEITVARLDEGGRMIGQKKASAAARLWAEAVKANDWPGYPHETVTAEIPAYVDTRWCAQEIEDPRFAGLPFDPLLPYERYPQQIREVLGPC